MKVLTIITILLMGTTCLDFVNAEEPVSSPSLNTEVTKQVAKFVSAPRVKKKRGQVIIRFTVSAKTDVEVAVLDVDKKIVRRLAAGVLGGKNDPPAPLKPGFDQSVLWDGNDDYGKKAEGAPFSVRVRIGMDVAYGRMLGGSPYTGLLSPNGPKDSIALSPDGSMYVHMSSLVGVLHASIPWQLRKFDKAGKYIKTILPYPASTSTNNVPAFNLAHDGSEFLMPRFNNALDPTTYHFGDNIYRKVVNNQVVFIGDKKLTFVSLDDSNAIKTVSFAKMKWKRTSVQIAFSPDGRYVYYSNAADIPYNPKKLSDFNHEFPNGRIYRQDLEKPGAAPEKFYDISFPEKFWFPNAWNKRTATGGIDVDTNGHIFVCDLVNQEIIELSPEGKKLSSIKVPWPDKVILSQKSDTIYVISNQVTKGYRLETTLYKINGRGSKAKVVMELPIGKDLGTSIALNELEEKPFLWIGGNRELIKFEDAGNEFIKGENLLNDKDKISFVTYGDVDVEKDLVYITNGSREVWRYDGKTGEGGRTHLTTCDVSVGPKGTVYAWGIKGFYGPVARYGRDLKPLPLASGKHTYGALYGRYGRGVNAPGLAVDWHGRVYALSGFNTCALYAFDKEGKLVDFERKAPAPMNVGEIKKGDSMPAYLSYVMDQGGSIQTDPKGNVYVLEHGLPSDFKNPKGFEKDPAFDRSTGTVYKFGPKGGTFKPVKGRERYEAEGALRRYYIACGPISGSWKSTGSVCHCTRPRFDVDAYGRLCIPNGLTQKVIVIDNNDNEILRFGNYGNYDSAGPDSIDPKPPLPMGWPIFSAVSDEHIYVGDGLNHRVLRVDKIFSETMVCLIK